MSDVGASDINDKAILNNTRQENGRNDSVRFHYTLPSGAVICSEWIAPDQRKPALMKWLDVVRERIVEDVKDIQRKKVGTGPRKKSPQLTQEFVDRVMSDDSPEPAVIGAGGPYQFIDDEQTGAVPPGRNVNQSADEPSLDDYLTQKLNRLETQYGLAAGRFELASAELVRITGELNKVRKLIAAMAQEN